MIAVPSVRTILFRLHWALGLTLGLVLVVMGATGALMSYEEAIFAFVHRHETAAGAEAPALSPTRLVARIVAQKPGATVVDLTWPGEAGGSVGVRFGRDPATGIRPVARQADPVDGRLLGSGRLEEAFGTVRSLHRWMLMPGDARGWGRTVTGLAALSLVVFLATGLYLRWPAIHGWRVWLRPRLSRPGRPRWWSLHAVAGTWLAPVYLVLALTGLTWSFPAWKDATTWLLTGEARPRSEARPAGEARPERAAGRERRPRAGEDAPDPTLVDRVWATFGAGEGRGAVLVILSIPGPEGGPIRIRWVPAGADPHGGTDQASFDGRTGALVAIARNADKPLGRRLVDGILDVHRGRFFGEAVALVFAVAALLLPGFAATGIWLFVLRRRGRNRLAGSMSAAGGRGPAGTVDPLAKVASSA